MHFKGECYFQTPPLQQYRDEYFIVVVVVVMRLEIALEVENLRSQLDDEARKKESQREENARRKHNYIPFISKLIDSLGDKDALAGLIAKTQQTEAAAAKQQA
jgi:hypothetical protein